LRRTKEALVFSLLAQMKTLNEILHNQPDLLFQCINDDEVKAYLVELGLVGFFKDDGSSRTQKITHRGHETHLIIILFATGKFPEVDNGYSMYCLPKHASELIKAVLDEIVKEHDTFSERTVIKTNVKSN
jgi:hypothetical protein